MQNPIRGFLHGGAALATLVGMVFLVVRSWGRTTAIVGALIFGLAMLAMYTVSSLYHSVPWGEKWKMRLQRMDHSMIYLMVAGTFTPIAIAALEGTSLVVGLTLVWSIAVTGILLKALMPDVATWLSVTLQLSMGWVAVFWTPRIVDRLGIGAVALILAGGFCYTLGAVIFMTKRPRLLPRSFSYHELFHVLVVAASIFHFAAILVYAIPATV
jgi:hemolysin III